MIASKEPIEAPQPKGKARQFRRQSEKVVEFMQKEDRGTLQRHDSYVTNRSKT